VNFFFSFWNVDLAIIPYIRVQLFVYFEAPSICVMSINGAVI
jgi:hypothetical protein